MSQPLYMPSTQPQSKLFVKPNGSGTKFFVEPAAVQERPKLVRRIQKYGGLIVSSAREADILLAENNTKEALEILDAWGTTRVVLSVRWVARCIDNDEFLGEKQNWGGFLLNRDEIRKYYTEIDDEDEDPKHVDDHDDSLYETSKPADSKRKTRISTVSSKTFQNERTLVSPSSGLTSGTPPSKKRKLVSDNTEDIDRAAQPSTPLPPASANSSILATPMNTSPTASVQPGSAAGVSNLATPTGMLPSAQDLQAVVQQQAVLINYFSGLFQQSSQQNAFVPLLPPTVTPTNLVPAVNLQSSPQFPQPLGLSQQMMFNPLNPLIPQLQPPATTEGSPNLIDQPPPGCEVVPAKHQRKHQTQTTSTTRPTPEDVQRASENLSSESEGEVQIAVLESKRKKRARQLSSSSYDEETIQTSIGSKPFRARPAVPVVKSGMFTDDKGLPSKFFVNLDLRNRKELLQIIRKHGGEIVLRMEQADYIILNNRSPQFQRSLELLPLDKIALSPTWLQECNETGTVVGLSNHIIDVTNGHGPGAAKKKTSRIRREKAAKAVDDSYESEEDAPQPPSSIQTPMQTQSNGAETHTLSRRGSRSPSPPSIRQVTPHGKFVFTDSDREWFFKYARLKLERDPKMSTTQLMKSTGRKAPYHTTTSWANIVRRKWKDEMEALQREIRYKSRIAMSATLQNAAANSQSLATSSSGLINVPNEAFKPVASVGMDPLNHLSDGSKDSARSLFLDETDDSKEWAKGL